VTRLLLRARIALVRAGFWLGSRRRTRAAVVLATSHDDRLHGNLAFIQDALASRHPDVRTIRLAHRATAGWRGRIRAVPDAVRAGYHLATARLFVVDDYYLPMYVIRPRPGTMRVQVWHASGAFKKFGYSVLDKTFGASEATIEHVSIHANYDLCLVSSMHVAPAYAEAFRQPIEKFVSRLGVPRTDVLLDDTRARTAAAAVRRRYAIPDGRRVILYAPTFRGDSVVAARHPDALDLERLQTVLGHDHVVLVRLHPFVRNGPRLARTLAGFAIDVSDHPDVNELMLVSDLLVTDYSSAIYEFSLLGRPIVFFAPDLDAYERERGFYFDYRKTVPGPIFETTDEVASYVREGRFDTEGVAAFARASFDVADGRASARFVEEVVLPALAGRRPASERLRRPRSGPV